MARGVFNGEGIHNSAVGAKQGIMHICFRITLHKNAMPDHPLALLKEKLHKLQIKNPVEDSYTTSTREQF